MKNSFKYKITCKSKILIYVNDKFLSCKTNLLSKSQEFYNSTSNFYCFQQTHLKLKSSLPHCNYKLKKKKNQILIIK